MRIIRNAFILLSGILFLTAGTAYSQEVKYQRPSAEVEEMILAKPLPKISFNGQMTVGVIYQPSVKYQPLSYIESIREFKVAGLRLNGDNFSQTRKDIFGHIELIWAENGATRRIAGLPVNLMAHDFGWSPDGRWLCFLNDTPREVELYRVDVTAETPVAVKINTRPVNSIFGDAYCFIGNDAVLYKSVPSDIGAFPKENFPNGPIVQSSKNKKDTYKTFQDLLKSPYDEAVFDYLCTAELSLFDGTFTRTVGGKGIISSFSASPDGKYVMYSTLHKPYPYSKPYSNFYKRISIMDMSGRDVRLVKEKGNAPKGTPARSQWEWRADKPATLVWKEKSTDKGAAKPYSLKQCQFPFDPEIGATIIASSESDITDVVWCNDKIAFYTESAADKHLKQIKVFNPSDPARMPVTLLTENTYNISTRGASFYGTLCKEKGSDKLVIDPKGNYVLHSGTDRMDENGLKYSYIDRISLKDGKAETLWTSGTEYRVIPSGIVSFSDKGLSFIATKESATEVPNYVAYKVDRKGRVTEKAISAFVNTLPHSDEIRMEYLQYKRADGLNCAARVYLPAGYDKERDGALPVFMWTYPYEHHTVESAECNHKAPHNSFAMPDQWNQIFWCLKGYAVVLEWTMAIVASDKDADYNENFIEHLKMNAEAIVDALAESGIGDRNRMAVGGLSYGSFMTANLLAHTNLYKCGFANSGAFNRTLTPYGFQYYGKDYWESEQIYHDMSPYNYADKIKTPILITHGQMDENTGTHPIQSERLYYAIAGHGGDATYLQLPYEGHKMAFRENVLHYFSVVEKMLDKYVKNANTK